MSQDLHVSGRGVSSLPGSSHPFPEGTVCDEHSDRPAVKRIQGETDSFGCEYHLMCQECVDKHAAEKAALDGGAFLGRCDCGAQEVPLFPKRDWEEGSAGPVYYKCRPCLTAWNIREREELDAAREDDVYDDYFDDDSIHDIDDDQLGPEDWEPQVASPPQPPVVSYKRRRKFDQGSQA